MKKSGKMSTVAYWLIGISLFIIISQYESVLIGFHKPVDLYAEDFKGVERFMSMFIISGLKWKTTMRRPAR